MAKFNPNRRTILSLVAMFVMAIVIPIVAGNALDASIVTQFVGVPIADTPFSEESSPVASSLMLPGTNISRSEDSVSMSINYSDYEMINLTQAAESVLIFVNQFEYLQDANLTLDEGWSILDAAEWRFRFIGDHMDLYAAVNAISSSVTSFHVSWVGPSPYVRELDSMTLQVQDVELSALEFLKTNNITLSHNSYYISPKIEYNIRYLTHYVYSMRFFEVINQTRVDGNTVSIHLDVSTGWVVSFNYQWTFINEIPTHGIITKETAKTNAIEYIVEHSDNAEIFNVVFTTLLFTNIASDKSPVYQLCWAVHTDHSQFSAIYINAINGDTAAVYQYLIGSSFIRDTTIDPLSMLLPFLASAPIAIIAYIGASYRIGKKRNQMMQPLV
jgi:hypothetical protein